MRRQLRQIGADVCLSFPSIVIEKHRIVVLKVLKIIAVLQQLSCPLKPFKLKKTRMWANAQRDGRPAEHKWRPLFNAAKFG